MLLTLGHAVGHSGQTGFMLLTLDQMVIPVKQDSVLLTIELKLGLTPATTPSRVATMHRRSQTNLDLLVLWKHDNMFRVGSPEHGILQVKNNGERRVDAQDVVIEEDSYRHQVILQLPIVKPTQTLSVEFTTVVKEPVTIRSLPPYLTLTFKRLNYTTFVLTRGLGKLFL